MPSPLLLAVDGNSLLHRAHHAMASGGLRDAANRPVWALKGLVSFIATAAARLTPDAVVVGFDCPDASARRDDFAGYKAQRAEKPADLVRQLDDAPELLSAAGFTVVVPDRYEADDVLASAAATARRHRWRTAVVTSDRDAFALIDEDVSVLRVVDGGIDGSPLMTPQKLRAVCGVPPERYRDFAAVRGDSSDNLTGAPGVGAKTAAKLLAHYASVDDAFAALDNGRVAEVEAVIGAPATARLTDPKARANVARNQRLMTMRTDLKVPALMSMALPLDRRLLQNALTARDIRLGPSLWALTGEPAPSWYGERVYGEGPRPDGSGRQVIVLPEGTRPRSRAGRRSAELSAAGQLSLF